MGVRTNVLRTATTIDYISLSLPKDNPAFNLWALEAHAMLYESVAHSVIRPVGMHGYQGAACDGLAVLFNEDRGMIRLSGEKTELRLPVLYNEDGTVSRIDLQTTVWYEGEPNIVIERALKSAQKAIDEGRTRMQKLKQIKLNDGGFTIYLGGRSSDVYLRMYNKYAESGLDPFWRNAVRYEAELKGSVAEKIGEQIGTVVTEHKTITEPCRRRIHATVKAEYEVRGVSLPVAAEDKAYNLKVPRKRSDIQQKLNWLAMAVSPTIRWLRDRGMERETLMALGLGHLLPCIDSDQNNE